MNRFFAWLYNRCRVAAIMEEEEERMIFSHSDRLGASTASDRPKLRSQGLQFAVHIASGGYAVEYVHHDDKTGEFDGRLHVIADADDIGDSISKIITMELLRR